MPKTVVATLVAIAAALVPAQAAVAAPPPAGGLNAIGCTAHPDYAALLGCSPGTPAIEGVHDLALSPDGSQLYAVGSPADGPDPGAIVTYARDAQTGALTFAGCRGQAADGCVDDPNVGKAGAVTLAPDGTDLYVSSYSSGVTHYRRGADGALTFAGCFTPTAVGGCTQVAGVNGATDLAVSPDGRSLYVSAYSDDSITTFDRDPASGALTWVECATTGAAAGCVDVSGELGNAFDSATGVAVTPDGTRVLASARSGDAATVFVRDAAGDLVEASSLAGDYLAGAQTIAASPDGGQAYVGLFDGSGLTTLSTPLGGDPGLLGCFQAQPDPPCASAPGVDGVFGLDFSPDGGLLYSAARNGNSVGVFTRGPQGALTPLDCVGAAVPSEDLPLAPGCRDVSGGLYGPETIAASADGRFVYAAGSVSLTTLVPERGPSCQSRTLHVPNDVPTELTIECTDPEGQHLATGIVGLPSHGTVTVVDQATRRLRYVPKGDFAGRTSFRVSVTDGTNATDATVTLQLFRTPPKLGISAKRVRLTALGRLRVKLSCGAGEPGGCKGRLAARSAKKLKRKGGKRRYVKLGAARFSVPAGATRTVAIKVPKAARRVVAAKGRLGVRLDASALDGAGNRGTQAKRIVVLAPKKPKQRR